MGLWNSAGVIDRGEAIRRALAYVSEMSTAAGQDFVLLEDLTREESFGWVFFWQSEAFVRSGDFRDQLGGNAPFVILRASGERRSTGTAHPVDHYLDEIRREYGATSG
jgi:hypothetical protein